MVCSTMERPVLHDRRCDRRSRTQKVPKGRVVVVVVVQRGLLQDVISTLEASVAAVTYSPVIS